MLKWLKFNLKYCGRPTWDTGVSPPELNELIGQIEAGRALDLGCGTGTNLLALAEAGWQVTGVEYALPAWLKARRRLRGKPGFKGVRLGSVAAIDTLKPAYDLILDIGCLHSLGSQERRAYRGHVERLLAPGGIYLLYGFLRTDDSIVGIGEDDIRAFASWLRLASRREGLDHGRHPSVWLKFIRAEN
jgi:cyclopropane fatty-acyl-phospholipid synthase-like methyltransferase